MRKIKSVIIDGKLIMVLDAVRFQTSDTIDRFDLSILQGRDYRIVVTHGVVGELVDMIVKNYYGLDKNKLIFLCNNIEAQQILSKNGCRAFNISEYVFLNDDTYNIIEAEKQYDCVYLGRRAKLEGLFKTPYKSDVKHFLLNEESTVNESAVTFEYAKSLSGIMTSKAEGSCRVIAEMLMCGLPIVSIKMPNLPKQDYFPHTLFNIYSTYEVVLPNTVGGRELWLDDYNSITCERNDEAIDNAIQEIIGRNLDRNIIRRDYLGRLFTERLKFLYLIKSTAEELDLNFWDISLDDFITLPYSNCSLQTQEWKRVVQHFKTLF